MSLGSPPRVRGKDSHYQATQSKPGITPACAGKSFPSVSCLLEYRDHPRVCGEKSAVSGCCAATSGSPPRVRGKAGLVQIVGRLRRITPACAGKSTCMAQSLKPREHHPRVCGEKVGPVGCVSGWLGSPPRMRGKAPSLAVLGACIGITPAYAGKSCPAVYGNRLAQDHPRVCGEKCRNPIIAQAEGGSPPRMRGKVPCVLFFGVGIGITPAYAGKSHSLFGTFGAARDHPRVCGEKRTQAHPAKTGLGSPPRMRGKETPDQGIDQEFGITPAYAGKR